MQRVLRLVPLMGVDVHVHNQRMVCLPGRNRTPAFHIRLPHQQIDIDSLHTIRQLRQINRNLGQRADRKKQTTPCMDNIPHSLSPIVSARSVKNSAPPVGSTFVSSSVCGGLAILLRS